MFDGRCLKTTLNVKPALLTLGALALLLWPGTTWPASAQSFTKQGASIEQGVEYRDVDGNVLRMDVIMPLGQGPYPGVELIHGGGYDGGTRTFMQGLGIFLAKQGFVGFTIDYRLAPDYPYPAAVEDAKAAVLFIRYHAKQFKVDPHRVGVFGTSAGGTIAASVATEGEGALDQGSRVAALASWSGPMDFRPLLNGAVSDHDFKITGYVFGTTTGTAGDQRTKVKQASPVTHVSCDDPPAFIANAQQEKIPLSQAESFVHALNAKDVPNELLTPPSGHAGQYGRLARGPTAAFFDKYLNNQPRRTGFCKSATQSSSPTPPSSPSSTTPANTSAGGGISTSLLLAAGGAVLVLAIAAAGVVRRIRR